MPVVARGLTFQAVDGAIARRGDDPACGAGRQPVGRPVLDRDRERILDRLFRDAEVAEDARQDRHRAAVLSAEDAINLRTDDQSAPGQWKGRTSIGSVVASAALRAHASAASRSAARMMLKPPTYSLPSANGPSVKRVSPSLRRTTVAVLGASSPPLNTQAPAFLSSCS